MSKILHKPNPLIEGLFPMNNFRILNIFNHIITVAQKSQNSKKDLIHASISSKEILNLINDKNITTIEKVQKYFIDNYLSNILTWKYNDKIYSTGLIQQINYNFSTGNYEFLLSKDLVNFIINYKELKTGYTPINLGLTSRNFYTQKLYEYLRMWSGTKKSIEIDLINLRMILVVGNKYPEYKKFKQKILIPVIEDLKKNYNMIVDFEEKRLLRKVEKIIFNVKDLEPRKYNFENVEIENNKTKNIIDCNISSELYVELIDLKINESIHHIFIKELNDCLDYKDILISSINKTLEKTGTKTINKRNYKYFKTVIRNDIEIYIENNPVDNISILQNIINKRLNKDII